MTDTSIWHDEEPAPEIFRPRLSPDFVASDAIEHIGIEMTTLNDALNKGAQVSAAKREILAGLILNLTRIKARVG